MQWFIGSCWVSSTFRKSLNIVYSAIRWLEFIKMGARRYITFSPRILYMVLKFFLCSKHIEYAAIPSCSCPAPGNLFFRHKTQKVSFLFGKFLNAGVILLLLFSTAGSGWASLSATWLKLTSDLQPSSASASPCAVIPCMHHQAQL